MDEHRGNNEVLWYTRGLVVLIPGSDPEGTQLNDAREARITNRL